MTPTTSTADPRVEVDHAAPLAKGAPARVLIAEDHTLVREGLRRLLAPEFDVLDTVADGRALLAAAQQLQPDIILVDISMPGLNGLEAARRLGRLSPQSRVIFVTAHVDPAYAREAFRAGAAAYVVKNSAFAELRLAIHEVLAKRRYLSPALGLELGTLLPAPTPSTASPRSEPLTTRQREVLQLVAEGRTARQIGETLHISRKTAEFHKAGLMRTLGLQSTAELTRYALERGVIGT